MIRNTLFPELILDREADTSVVPKLCGEGFRVLLLVDAPSESEKRLFGRRSYDFDDAALVARSTANAAEDLPPHCAWIVAFSNGLSCGGSTTEKRGGVWERFSYRTGEALHLSSEEKRILTGCFEDLRHEAIRQNDCYCRCILARHIDRMAEYVDRFYDRQFITREEENRRLLADYRNFLSRYLAEGRVALFGIPSCALCASRLHLSESYFADLLRFETGHTHEGCLLSAQFDAASWLLLNTRKSVGQIAAELGYPSACRFSHLFRKLSGLSPDAFRSQKQKRERPESPPRP